MDVKSLAKSKRNHTQHNKKHHANHKPKLQPQSHSPFPSSSNPNQNGAVKERAIEKKTNRSKRDSSALPGNWDRYEEEELDSVPEIGSKTLDVVVPKSKGADFRFLVAEAQSNADKTLDGFNEALPCMWLMLNDDNWVICYTVFFVVLMLWLWFFFFAGEFGVGLSSILEVRGEGIVSWVGDDNFVVQDKTSAYQEVICLLP